MLNKCIEFVQSRLAQACLLCGGRFQGEVICPGCVADLPELPVARCPVCALPTPLGEVCGACLRHPPAFAATQAVFSYDFPLDALVQHLKYGGELALARFFANRLLATLQARRSQASTRPDLIVPMPLHPERLKRRGFNQAAEIARHLGRGLEMDVALDQVFRQRNTPPQVALKLADRQKNLRGAFACRGDFAGRRVALLDDVMTSGASLNALAECVKKAGASEVETWVIARTL